MKIHNYSFLANFSPNTRASTTVFVTTCQVEAFSDNTREGEFGWWTFTAEREVKSVSNFENCILLFETNSFHVHQNSAAFICLHLLWTERAHHIRSRVHTFFTEWTVGRKIPFRRGGRLVHSTVKVFPRTRFIGLSRISPSRCSSSSITDVTKWKNDASSCGSLSTNSEMEITDMSVPISPSSSVLASADCVDVWWWEARTSDSVELTPSSESIPLFSFADERDVSSFPPSTNFCTNSSHVLEADSHSSIQNFWNPSMMFGLKQNNALPIFTFIYQTGPFDELYFAERDSNIVFTWAIIDARILLNLCTLNHAAERLIEDYRTRWFLNRLTSADHHRDILLPWLDFAIQSDAAQAMYFFKICALHDPHSVRTEATLLNWTKIATQICY